jgi:hypothetical protein
MAETMTLAARREHWRGVVEQWRQSGLKKAPFCRDRGLALWQFHYWHGRLAGAAPAGSGVFARVRSVGGSGLRLRLGGLELEVEPGFDEATLRRLLRALGAAC